MSLTTCEMSALTSETSSPGLLTPGARGILGVVLLLDLTLAIASVTIVVVVVAVAVHLVLVFGKSLRLVLVVRQGGV